MKYLKRWSVLVLLPLFSNSTPASTEYTFHSVFIYNFLKYIEWPPDAVATGERVIGVIGSSEATEALRKMATTKSVGNTRIVVKSFPSAAALTSCHVIFLTDSASDQLANITAKTNGKPVLLITEKPGLIEKGSGINFVTVGGKMAFELHQKQLKDAGLKVSGNLLKLAILI